MSLSDSCFDFLDNLDAVEFKDDLDDAVDELVRSAKWYQEIDNEYRSNSEMVVYVLGETETLITACNAVKTSTPNALENLIRLAQAILHFHDMAEPNDELTNEINSAIALFN